VKHLDKYKSYENEYVSWDSMRRLLNLDTTEKVLSKKWITDKVINFYFKKYLAEMDQKQCKEEPEQNCSGFLSLFFWQGLTNEKNDDMTVQGTYNYGNVSRWARKLPRNDIFNLKNTWENRQNLHVFNLWPVIYHTHKNSCANPTPETLSVEIYTSQQYYPKSTRFYFVAINISQGKTVPVQISHVVFLLLKYHAQDDYYGKKILYSQKSILLNIHACSVAW
jgi:hypothetical protein